MNEKEFQESVAELLDTLGLVWTHCPNEGRRSVQHAVMLKRAGLKPGVPDVLIFNSLYGYPWRGLAIELKVGRNKQQPSQLLWQRRLETECNWIYEVAYSIDDVIKILKKVGLLK